MPQEEKRPSSLRSYRIRSVIRTAIQRSSEMQPRVKENLNITLECKTW